MRLRTAAALSVLFALCACSAAQIAKKGTSYTFRANYAKGKVLKFDFVTRIGQIATGAKGPTQKLTFPVVMKVESVTWMKDHGRVAKVKSDAGPWLLDGKPFRNKTSVTVHVDALNRIVHGPAEEVAQFAAPLPEKPLKIGGSWSSDIDTKDAAPVSIKVRAVYTLQKVVKGLAYIGVKLSGKGAPGSGISTEGKGTMLLRVSDGTLHSMSLSQRVLVGVNVGATTTISVTRRA
jgi:hypothetical protein